MVKKTNYENGFKFKVALATVKGDKTYEEIATEFSISKSMISKWRDELMKCGSSLYGKAGKEQKSKSQEVIEQKLYQQIGQLTMEVDFLKKFASKYNLR